MPKILLKVFLFSFIVNYFNSCKKENLPLIEVTPIESNLTIAEINVSLKNNSLALMWDTLNNVNTAGNIYSVHKMHFYISNISLKRDDGYLFESHEVYFIDPSLNAKSLFTIDSIPKGIYTQITFLVGLDPTKNIDYGLRTTVDNLNMAWPTAMGGGYHFMKMEGHYIDSSNTVKGYAIHLGKNKNVVKETIINTLNQQNTMQHYSLLLNVNEVFANPYSYNLCIDNNYTMTDSTAMLKIKTNLQNAFTLIQNN